jgi:acyl carrier protein
MDTLARLNVIFRDVFEDETIEIGDGTTADDVEGWDSMSHVTLILAIETRFKVRFKQKELMSFRTVGDLARCLDARLSGA